ncbi:MAG: DUF2589 domain-containing protein, partial [Archaeoglobi archaeon]|nr:DUF2589 domain-containing protein [Archaeoglobi archaeon]
EVEIEFDAKIVAVRPEKKVVQLYAIYAPRSSSRVDLSGEMHVKIKARRADVPEGIARMLTALANSLGVKGEK